MKAIDLRVREDTLELARALVAQRGVDRAALLREALDIGMLIIAASGPPAEDSATEIYGTLSGVRLAQRLRPYVAALLDFLSRYGATPLTILPALSPTPTSLPLQPPSQGQNAILIDTGVNAALDAFGVEALGDIG